MASQKVFIDLVDNEAEHQDFGSRQHKVTPFEASMESMERNTSKITQWFDMNGQGKGNRDKLSSYMAESDQKMEMGKLAELTKDGKRDLDFSLFDGSKYPHSHLRALMVPQVYGSYK
ncbi:hypothetical protein HAX54_045749 [Datura stramonium]|uniref:Uncharacterized protein n=1 Tax=Datura stramonium TaxID=4076 RepID=A0ABS8SQU4_DATST|nr:hypothetical protein [Datura stramonium]